MMDDIIEVVLELILDGAIEAAGSKRVPMPLRILSACVILIFSMGLIGLLLWIGIDNGSTGLIILAVVLLAVFSGWLFSAVRRHRRNASR